MREVLINIKCDRCQASYEASKEQTLWMLDVPVRFGAMKGLGDYCPPCAQALAETFKNIRRTTAVDKPVSDKDTSNERINCAECQRSYGNAVLFNQHMVNNPTEAHKPERMDGTPWPFACTCDRAYGNQRGLDRHITVANKSGSKFKHEAAT